MSKVVEFDGTKYRLREVFSTNFSEQQNITQVYGIVLHPKRDEVLVVSKDGYNWTLPGGTPEMGETSIETLAREVEEESSVTIDQSSVEPVFYVKSEVENGGGWDFNCTQLRYFAKALSVNEFISDPAGDIKFAYFVPVNDLNAWLSWGDTGKKIVSILNTKGYMGEAEDNYWLDKTVVAKFADSKVSDSLRETVNRILKRLPVDTGLDLGCGGGRNSEYMQGCGVETYAIDKYSTMVTATRSKLLDAFDIAPDNLNRRVLLGKIERLPFADDSFGLVISSGVLHNAMTEQEFITALKEVYRVLVGGGYFYINIFYAGDSIKNMTRVGQNLYTVQENFIMFMLAEKDLIDTLARQGFESVELVSKTIEGLDVGARDVIRLLLKKP